MTRIKLHLLVTGQRWANLIEDVLFVTCSTTLRWVYQQDISGHNSAIRTSLNPTPQVAVGHHNLGIAFILTILPILVTGQINIFRQ